MKKEVENKIVFAILFNTALCLFAIILLVKRPDVKPVNKYLEKVLPIEKKVVEREIMTSIDKKQLNVLLDSINALKNDITRLKKGTDSLAIILAQEKTINIQDLAIKKSGEIIHLQDSTIIDLKQISFIKDEVISEQGNRIDKLDKKVKRNRKIAIGAGIIGGTVIVLQRLVK